MKLSCSSSTLALVAALLTLAVDVQAAGAATRTIPRTVPTWADLADEDIRGFWQSIIVLDDGGIAVAKTLTEVTNSYPWAVSSDYDKLARTDASGGGKWVRQWDGPVNVMWLGASGVDDGGVTDDTEELDAAIAVAEAVGCSVYLPTGTYEVTTSASTHSNLKLIGDGDASVIELQYTGSSNSQYLWLLSSLTNVAFSDMKFVGGFSILHSDDDLSQDMERIELNNVWFSNIHDGLLYTAKGILDPSAYSVNEFIARGIHADADLSFQAATGQDLFSFNGIPTKRVLLEDFYCNNIGNVLKIDTHGTWDGTTSGTYAITIRNGIVENVVQSASRGNVRAFYVGGETSMDNVRFQNSLVTDTGINDGSLLSGGTGYTANDVLTVSGGTPDTAAQIRVDTVSAGVIQTFTVVTAGDYEGVLPSNPVSVTGGTGNDDATFLLEWGPASSMYHTAVYDNNNTTTIQNCTFQDWAPCYRSETISFKTGAVGGGHSVVRNCHFEETNGFSTGTVHIQGNDISLENCTWVDWNGGRSFSTIGRDLIVTSAGESPVGKISITDCRFQDVYCDKILGATANIFTGVINFERNRVFLSNSGKYGISLTTTAAGLARIANNYVDGDFAYFLSAGTGAKIVYITGNYVDGRLMYCSDDDGVYYIDNNSVTGSPSISFNGDPPRAIFGRNNFSYNVAGDFLSADGSTVTNLDRDGIDGDPVLYLGGETSASVPLPGSIYWNSVDSSVGINANGRWRYVEPLKTVASVALSGSVWLTPGTDNSVQVVTSAGSTPEFLLSATNAVAGTVWRVVNQDGANTLDVDNTDGSTLIKTIGTSSWAEFRWTGSTYVLVGYGGL